MTLFVHRDTSTAALAEGLADLLATPLPDPFAEEVVAVPAKGVERWLAQRLSHTLGAGPSGHDGVCAGVRFLSPHSLVSMVLGVERDDPWHADRLVWPVLESIDASLDEEWAETLATHLGHGSREPGAELRRGRRYAVARRLAGLFAAYASSRPAMLTDWRGGGDGDGLGGRVEPDLAWQPPLWREVLRRVDAEPPDVRHDRVVGRCARPRVT
ncbi:exodeoxyribonuclease V subunit gamma [Serinicoccus chungangensis]|uniref:exodeoxyribonuclease V subunit gamma n=1 Tax=Serinicoccus chungangensis TaxID=767452 RepID=UPI0023AF1B80|nr:exodeoxyribonuclease V subunit gamma [Serinicoccus chungangensis]